ncbi:hypothetical protein ACTJKB_08940 [Paenibacillus sp. 22594]
MQVAGKEAFHEPFGSMEGFFRMFYIFLYITKFNYTAGKICNIMEKDILEKCRL